MKRFLFALAFTACGGTPFSTAPDAFNRFDADPPDVQSATADAGPAEAGESPDVDGGAGDAAPDADVAQPDAGDAMGNAASDAPLEAAPPDAPPDAPAEACTPLAPHDAGAPGPTCGIGPAMSPTFFLVLTPDDGCQWVSTPPACLCVETFNCACLLAQPAPCVGVESCTENGPSQGGPTVSCK